jgi:hypothetical protein
MIVRIFLLLVTFVAPAFAGTIDEETIHIRDSYLDFFRDFPKTDSGQQMAMIPRSTGFNGKGGGLKVNGAYYNNIAKDNYEKAQIMQSLSTLALGLANTAGSAYAFESSKTAATQGAALSASSDPQFQQMGQLFTQESTQIAQNDRVAADNTAAQIQSVPPPYVSPNYQPTQNEQVIVQAFVMAVGAVITAYTGVLGAMAYGALVNALGIGGSSGMSSAAYTLGSGLAGSAYKGTSAGVPLTNGGVQAINSGVGTAQAPVYQIPPLTQPQGASGGSALPGS